MTRKRIFGAVASMLILSLARAQEPAAVAPLTLGEVVRRALAHGFDMELQGYDLAIAKDKIPGAKSAFNPELSASVAKDVSRTAADALLPGSRSEGTHSRAGVAQRLTTGASVALDANLDRSEINPTFAALNRSQLALQRLEQEVLINVRNGVRNVETGVESARLAAQSAQLSGKQYEFENARFRSGLSTSRRVLEAQVDLETARVTLVQAKLNLQMALASLRRVEGSGLEYYGIELGNR